MHLPGAPGPDFQTWETTLFSPPRFAENILLPAHNRISEDETANSWEQLRPRFQPKTRNRPLFCREICLKHAVTLLE